MCPPQPLGLRLCVRGAFSLVRGIPIFLSFIIKFIKLACFAQIYTEIGYIAVAGVIRVAVIGVQLTQLVGLDEIIGCRWLRGGYWEKERSVGRGRWRVLARCGRGVGLEGSDGWDRSHGLEAPICARVMIQVGDVVVVLG
jgi:hypothetical protein